MKKVSIPFKRERLSKAPKKGLRVLLLQPKRFNSLQTGKTIQSFLAPCTIIKLIF